jgi:hypothetical protein
MNRSINQGQTLYLNSSNTDEVGIEAAYYAAGHPVGHNRHRATLKAKEQDNG